MNKILLTVTSAIVFLTSCKKDYTCECKSTSTFPGSSPSSKLSTTGKMKKDDAIQKCNEGDGTANWPYYDPNTNQLKNYSTTTSCELK